MSAVPFAGVGRPFQKHAERQAEGTPRESIDEFIGRAVLALPRAGASKDGERPWFSGQVVEGRGLRLRGRRVRCCSRVRRPIATFPGVRHRGAGAGVGWSYALLDLNDGGSGGAQVLAPECNSAAPD